MGLEYLPLGIQSYRTSEEALDPPNPCNSASILVRRYDWNILDPYSTYIDPFSTTQM